jgi:hypothetical protein
MDLQKVECEITDWIDVAQDRDRWWALANAVMNIWVQKTWVIFLKAENRLVSQQGLCFME